MLSQELCNYVHISSDEFQRVCLLGGEALRDAMLVF